MIKTVYKETSNLYLENIKTFHLEEIIMDYDEKVFSALRQKHYPLCERYLADFCFEILHLSDEKQVLILKTFFISIVNDIINIKVRKKRLHPKVLASAYGIIAMIEKWTNISEYILSIPTYVNCLKNDIIGLGILFEGNKHIEQALNLINEHLEGKILTVNWLAEQLGVSTTHLSNLFKIQLDETVSNYIMKRKMDEIIYEITYTTKSIKEIREKYGFHNHSHFIKYFKKYQGVTPLQFMKETQKSI